MDKKLKDKWVKALMSGKYEQGGGQLQFRDRFCCLGVLGAVCGYKNIAEHAYLVDEDWEKRLPLEIQRSLARMNDQQVPFPVIAGFIQENL